MQRDRHGFAVPASMTHTPWTPFTGVTPWARQSISGAQNLSGFPLFNPGHWALGLQNLELLRFQNCAWLCRANAPGPLSAVGAAFGRPQAFPLPGGRTIPPDRGKCPGGTKGAGWPEGPDEGDVLNARTPGKSPRAGLGPAPTAFIGQVSAFLQGRHTGPPGPVGRDACGARPSGRAVPCAAALPARGGGVPAFYARPSAGAVPDFSRRPIHFRRLLCKRDRGIIFFHLRGKFHTHKGYPHFPPSFPQCVMLSATRPHFA